MWKKLIIYGGWISLFALSGVQSVWADISRKDPYQEFNRHAFALNQKVDQVIYKPVATIYQAILPDVAQKGVTHFFDNLDDLTVIANDVLQGKVYQGTQDIWRVFFNTTLGVGGLFDVASKIGLPSHHNDFGMTLTHWGYKNTNYFVIPLLGPSTVRDTYGLAVDYEVLSVYPYIRNQHVRYSLVGLHFVETRAGLLKLQKVIDAASIDPYVFQRDAYLQRRDHIMRENFSEDNATKGETNNDSGQDTYVPE